MRITGTVIDDSSNEPIPGATIAVVDRTTDKIRGEYFADGYGRFQFDRPFTPTEELLIAKGGYSSLLAPWYLFNADDYPAAALEVGGIGAIVGIPVPGDVYNAGDLINKTLIAHRDVPVYIFPGESEVPIGIVKAGNPVGIVYSYLSPSPTQDRTRLWWQFSPASNYDRYYYAPHEQGYYDVSAIRQQGVLTLEEKQEEEELANLPWYERLIRKYGGWVVLAVLGSAAIRGYFSRPRQN